MTFSEIYEVVYHDALANFDAGAITKAQMQEFDQMCLVQETEADKTEQPPVTEGLLA